jgi:hypothetical protein
MDNQNKEQMSPTNKHLEKKNKITFKSTLKKFQGGGKLNSKASFFFPHLQKREWRRSTNLK